MDQANCGATPAMPTALDRLALRAVPFVTKNRWTIVNMPNLSNGEATEAVPTVMDETNYMNQPKQIVDPRTNCWTVLKLPTVEDLTNCWATPQQHQPDIDEPPLMSQGKEQMTNTASRQEDAVPLAELSHEGGATTLEMPKAVSATRAESTGIETNFRAIAEALEHFNDRFNMHRQQSCVELHNAPNPSTSLRISKSEGESEDHLEYEDVEIFWNRRVAKANRIQKKTKSQLENKERMPYWIEPGQDDDGEFSDLGSDDSAKTLELPKKTYTEPRGIETNYKVMTETLNPLENFNDLNLNCQQSCIELYDSPQPSTSRGICKCKGENGEHFEDESFELFQNQAAAKPDDIQTETKFDFENMERISHWIENLKSLRDPTTAEQADLKRKFDFHLSHNYLSNSFILDWIESHIGEKVSEPPFIRAMVTAVLNNSISGSAENCEVDVEKLKTRMPILQYFISDKDEAEIQALFALQALILKLNPSKGVLQQLLDTLYREDVIRKSALDRWEVMAKANPMRKPSN